MINNIILKYIDAKLLIYGEIKSNDICQRFGYGRIKVSRLFQVYLKERPTNMKYVPAKKCYVIGFVFEPVFLKDDSPRLFLDAIELVFS
ncbi:hypothetical protein ACPV39_22055 [Photobacterium damselae]